MEWYIGVLKKYAVFSGRARRKEFWMFVLFNAIIGAVLSVLSRIGGIGIVFSILSGLYSLAILVPSLAVSFRRLHDVGKSGYYILFGLIPIVGLILLIIWTVKEGVAGSNEYGPNPKA